MEISGRVAQVIVKDGKDHDIRFALGLDDDELVQLLRWLRNREGLVLNIEPRVYQRVLPEMPAAVFTIDGQEYPILPNREDGSYWLTGQELCAIAGIEQVYERVSIGWLVDANEPEWRFRLVEAEALVCVDDVDGRALFVSGLSDGEKTVDFDDPDLESANGEPAAVDGELVTAGVSA